MELCDKTETTEIRIDSGGIVRRLGGFVYQSRNN